MYQTKLFSSILIRKFSICPSLCKKMPDNMKGRKKSSQYWLFRQLNDEYVMKAKMENFRARSAFKLIQIDDKHRILKPGYVVVECGAAPGAWTQVCAKRINSTGLVASKPRGLLIAIDLLPMYPVEGAVILPPMDFTDASSQKKVSCQLNGSLVDVVLSDMAPSASGTRELDQDSILQLAFSVAEYADKVSKDGASLLIKLWDGGRTKLLEEKLKLKYSGVRIVKPPSSRSDSAEIFILAQGYKKNQNYSDCTTSDVIK